MRLFFSDLVHLLRIKVTVNCVFFDSKLHILQLNYRGNSPFVLQVFLFWIPDQKAAVAEAYALFLRYTGFRLYDALNVEWGEEVFYSSLGFISHGNEGQGPPLGEGVPAEGGGISPHFPAYLRIIAFFPQINGFSRNFRIFSHFHPKSTAFFLRALKIMRSAYFHILPHFLHNSRIFFPLRLSILRIFLFNSENFRYKNVTAKFPSDKNSSFNIFCCANFFRQNLRHSAFSQGLDDLLRHGKFEISISPAKW